MVDRMAQALASWLFSVNVGTAVQIGRAHV